MAGKQEGARRARRRANAEGSTPGPVSGGASREGTEVAAEEQAEVLPEERGEVASEADANAARGGRGMVQPKAGESDSMKPAQEETAAEVPESCPPEEAVVPLEQHQRLLAEFDNYRKRVERDQARFQQWTAGELHRRLLPLLDDFNRAGTALIENPDEIDREGILIILGRLAEALEREGLVEIEATPGTEFDPEVHEAVLTIPSAEVPEGSVAEVLETGYRFGDRLLRPARVAVARSPEQCSPGEDEDTW